MDIHGISDVVALAATNTKAAAATTNFTGIDITKYDGGMKLVLDATVGTGTTPTLDVKIQDSADSTNGTDGAWADLSPAVVFVQVAAAAYANGVNTQAIGVQANNVRKWIRAVATVGGSASPTFTFSVVASIPRQYV